MVDLNVFPHRHFVVFPKLERLDVLVKSSFFLRFNEFLDLGNLKNYVTPFTREAYSYLVIK